MANIIENGSNEWVNILTCHKCGTVFKATQDDLGIDRFKVDPNTYWFDGTAIGINRYYVWCPNRCDVVIIPDDEIPELAKHKAVHEL